MRCNSIFYLNENFVFFVLYQFLFDKHFICFLFLFSNFSLQ